MNFTTLVLLSPNFNIFAMSKCSPLVVHADAGRDQVLTAPESETVVQGSGVFVNSIAWSIEE